MNALPRIALLLALVSSAALPALASNATSHGTSTGKTRAEVLAELEQARQDGTLENLQSGNGFGPEFLKPARPTPATKAPASKVQTEAQSLAQPASTGRTREEVLEELRRAQADGGMRCIRTNRGC